PIDAVFAARLIPLARKASISHKNPEPFGIRNLSFATLMKPSEALVDEDAQAPIVAHLARGAKRIDTQGAIVLLKGDEAIKIRRAIRLPFLDYSTLEKRRAAAEAEIAINRAYAPHIYRDAAAIRRTGDGYGFAGEGEIVEWATRMRRFDEEATLDKVAM